VRDGLRRVAEFAQAKAASIHMPRIGCGLAGGTWDEVGRLVQEELADKEIEVHVYDFQ
jgi:O-acetyl-ADP-ribose deacetylase (regulator of RNase III)